MIYIRVIDRISLTYPTQAAGSRGLHSADADSGATAPCRATVSVTRLLGTQPGPGPGLERTIQALEAYRDPYLACIAGFVATAA